MVDGANVNGGRAFSLKLRDKLFFSFSTLSIVILLAAAWVINKEVVDQARHQVREEVKASLPLYDAVWDEQAGRLSTLGMAMAGSPIVKTIFGDPRASRDRETIHQMLAEFGQKLSENVDLIMICDGGGAVTFSESHDPTLPKPADLPAARKVSASQKSAQSFEILGGRLLHLAWTPVVSHSSSAEFNNTLAVLVTGSELNHEMANELRKRAKSNVLFFAGDRLYASSLDPGKEDLAARTIAASDIGRIGSDQPVELTIGGESQLVFARQLAGFDGRTVGHVVVVHSLAGAAELFHAISIRLFLVGSCSIVLVLMISYLIARRITQPIEILAVGAREFGLGKYERSLNLEASGEIGQLAAAFDQMRESIRRGQAVLLRSERLATIGQMASSIIHDLRSPLGAISNAAELFANAELSAEQRKLLSESQLRASHRMAAMLKELLDYSKGKYSLKLQCHELAPLIQSVVQDSIVNRGANGVAVDAHIAPGLFVRVDHERIRRLFENLLINSIQAMPGGGSITIRGVNSGKTARISISDTGSGIPAELRERLFEPFVGQGKKGGTGLGLAIASSIAEVHGGSISLVSPDNQPAEFCIELPLVSGANNGA